MARQRLKEEEVMGSKVEWLRDQGQSGQVLERLNSEASVAKRTKSHRVAGEWETGKGVKETSPMDRKTKCLSLIYTLETFPSHLKIPGLKTRESRTPLGA